MHQHHQTSKGSVAKYSAQNNQEIKPQKRVINIRVLNVGNVLHTSNKASFANFVNPDLYYIIFYLFISKIFSKGL